MVRGYVATGYSGRSTGEVEDELSRYYEWYDIDRIFLDQQSASTGQVGYYEELTNTSRTSLEAAASW